jgi:hypothetical protein
MDSHSLGKTILSKSHYESCRKNGPFRLNGQGSEIRDNYSSMLGKNSPDSPWLMFNFLREDVLPDLIDVSGRIAQMTQFIS